jgi:hypothetical protein
MALDKTNTNIYYLLGRYTAVVEMANNEPFNGNQMHNIMQCTNNLVRYDRNVTNLMEQRGEIMALVPADGWPLHANTTDASNRFWMGYYHQKAAMSTDADN